MKSQYQIKHTFLNETLIGESYTNAWLKLINRLEQDKCGNISFENATNFSKTCYNIDGGKQHALATDEEVSP